MAYTSLGMVGKSLAGNAKILAAGMMDPFINYRFRIEIEGIELMGFNKMSILENETGIETYSEGGQNNIVHKFPKETSYANIVFEHGLSIDNTIYNWREDVIKGEISESIRSGTIKVYNQNFMRSIWHFHGAWPCKLTIDELDASAGGGGAVLIEKVELVIERFDRIVIADPTDMMMDMASDAASMITKPLGKFASKIKKAVKSEINDQIDKKKDQLKMAAHKVTDPLVDAAHKVTDPLEDKMYARKVAAAKEKKERKKALSDRKKERDKMHDPKARAAAEEKEEKAAANQEKKDQQIKEREERKEAKNSKSGDA